MTRDRLLAYFERELTYLRTKGEDFAHRFPGVAAALDLKRSGTTDPHVERLIESFAFLTSRIHQKLDESGAAISGSLLEVLLPHLVRPVPSLAIAQISHDTTRGLTSATQTIPAQTQLHSPRAQGQRCIFHTCYDVHLNPVHLVSAHLSSPQPGESVPEGAHSVLTLELAPLQGESLRDLSVSRLRLYLTGSGQLPFKLYDFILNQRLEIQTSVSKELSPPTPPWIESVGMERHEGLLPYAEMTPLGHRLLMEYLLFPEKFLFVDLVGLTPHMSRNSDGRLLVHIFNPNPPELWAGDVTAACFQAGCTPIVNCFERSADPIAVDNRRSEYRIVAHPFHQEAMEIYAVTRLEAVTADARRTLEYRPLYAVDWKTAARSSEARFWITTRKTNHRDTQQSSPTDVFVSVVDARGATAHLEEDIIRPTLLCTNHDLPSRLPMNDKKALLSMPGKSPGPIRCITQPTPSLRRHMTRDAQWQLVSLLAQGHASLADPKLATASLKQLLSILAPTNSVALAQQINGIHAVQARPISARIDTGGKRSMALGLEISLTLDPGAFIGGSAFLFASVLERYFGLLAPLNSFTQLTVSLKHQAEVLYRWPPRSGVRSLS